MLTSRSRWLLAAALVAALPALAPAPAAADISDVYGTSIVRSANTAIKAALAHEHETDAQARPIGETEKPLAAPGLPAGLTFQYDLSMAKSEGNTGYRNGLPGGMDGLIGYGFSPHFRLQAAYYDFQEYPLGFDTGTVPLYLQGVGPIGTTNLATDPIDVTTKNNIVVLQAQTLFTIAHKLPIVITPTYIARSGTLGGHTDFTQIEINGFPQTVPLRHVQYYLAAVTIPLLSTPKFFGTITAAPQWNVNVYPWQQNHAQIFELAYLEFRATKHVTLFVQPSRLVNNLPNDITAQYIPTFIYGVAYKINKYAFAQLVASTGTPSNRSQLGITAVTLQQVPDSLAPPPPSAVAPTIGGLKATQIQLQIGIGSPSVIPL